MPRRTKVKGKPREAVSRERALQVALQLADEEGLEALTMRRLAQALGVEAMSLYHHVASKEAILDGMVDLVFAQIALPPEDLAWRPALEVRTRSAREVLARHPWAVTILESRATPGLATLTHHDAVLGCLRRAGFSLSLTGHAYAVLDAFLYGFALQEASLPFQTPAEGQAVAGAMMEAFPAGAFQHLAGFAVRHVLQPGYAYANEFEPGLALVLDGLERLRRAEAEAGGGGGPW